MRYVLVIAAGGLMMLSSIPHGVMGWGAMRSSLQSAGVDAHLIGPLAAGWHFGSMAMAVFGLIVILAGVRCRRGDRSGVTAALVIAAAYVVFGFAGFLLRGFNTHFLLFAVAGALAGVPLLGKGRLVS